MQCKHNSRNMKRSGDSEGEKRRKRRRLLQELGDQKIPFLGPTERGFQQLWDSSYTGLVLRRSCSLPVDLHAKVEAAFLTLRKKGSLLRDLVRVRDRDVFTAVSRALLGEPGHTYRYLDTRLFAIPWHSEDNELKGETCCDPDFRAACKALWELNNFFCSDVSQLKEGDRLVQGAKAVNTEVKQGDEGDSEDSKNSEGVDSESRQSEEGDTESKHSEEWDLESKHSDEGCSGTKAEGEWETGSKNSSEEGESSSQIKQSETSISSHSEAKCPTWVPKTICGSDPKPMGLEDSEKPVAQLKHSLSDYHIEDKENRESRCSPPSSPVLCSGPVQFNVTLLNYMDPAAMSQLKEEPYYGMGKMAVGWHHDQNLVTHSPVAVYSFSCCPDQKGESSEGSSSERTFWRIGLKVAWDIHTPGLILPLESGDCYYMRDDLNTTHQHCVLAGDTARFSSTHRVAECSRGTLAYIQTRCQEALSNLCTDPETGSHSLLALLPTTLQHCEEIHNEVEFEWLRQYWFQGRRYTCFCSWWSGPMEQLENDWRLMETMTKLFLAMVEDDGRAEDNRRDMAETLLSALTDRHQQRQTWRDRCHSTLAQTLPPEEAPVDRPFWGVDDPSMPLPFDLADIINRVESLLWRM
ncbi:hypothetical protein NQD34_001801 [Periophthalmus magnuspinnatus]|nr:hypothetical protein NQD34_001801 [Periophthalmus magnuspinnatus]